MPCMRLAFLDVAALPRRKFRDSSAKARSGEFIHRRTKRTARPLAAYSFPSVYFCILEPPAFRGGSLPRVPDRRLPYHLRHREDSAVDATLQCPQMNRLAWPCQPAALSPPWPLIPILILAVWATSGHGMTDDDIASLKQDTRDLFYHGFNNYMAHAFPEDELKPLSCQPQVRNRDNPADIGTNDVLGNYSLTLIDSLSTLAILASEENEKDGHSALKDFQSGVQNLVELYGDGDEDSCGARACGFDLDSKVQVFETNIRGVGGLLSAHLFAIGELPIRGYQPKWKKGKGDSKIIQWKGFKYDGQLLRLAHNLASRLLPAFNTATGLPYPRVNLRHGIPFYQDAEDGVCRLDGTSTDPREITETCTAGAGSLVLEFATLSRLSGDLRFEKLAKQAFWAVFNRRSAIGLLAGGIDAENGQWTNPPLAGIGAGIDSFFEYGLKSHILLSSLPPHEELDLAGPPDAFLMAWQDAHSAVRRHVYRSNLTEKHPFYGQVDLITGAPKYSWIDNLSAYYPGLLTLAGEVEEAIESHLLFSALWTRYSALPERWHVFNGFIDPNFKHWAGRPEFIESTFYLYQATKDPWYLHVGEMTLRDIRRRCWTRCGWADLGDVVSGEQRDRMESFFLGETAKYLYLLFDENHPLNKMDAAVVFTTEGHPLTIPRPLQRANASPPPPQRKRAEVKINPPTCPVPAKHLPFTTSNLAARHDLFHAAALTQLHLVPINPARESALHVSSPTDGPGISLADIRSPSNYTFYPWTLPQSLIPPNGMSSPIRSPAIQTLTFPNMAANEGLAGALAEKGIVPIGALQKVLEGVLINSLSNVRLNMVEQPKSLLLPDDAGMLVEAEVGKEFRVHGIANWALGRDEKVLLSGQALEGVSPADPHFTRVKDLEMCDLVVEIAVAASPSAHVAVEGIAVDDTGAGTAAGAENATADTTWHDLESLLAGLFSNAATTPPTDDAKAPSTPPPSFTRHTIPAILPTGAGAAPLPPYLETSSDPTTTTLPLQKLFYLDDTLCHHTLPREIAKGYDVLVIRRGECSFGDKLARIPSFAPGAGRLGLVVVVSVPEAGASHRSGAGAEEGELIRPLLDSVQMTPSGLERRHPIAMVMVDGGTETVEALRAAANGVGVFDGEGRLMRDEGGKGAVGVKRRYWFESLGVPIGNLILV